MRKSFYAAKATMDEGTYCSGVDYQDKFNPSAFTVVRSVQAGHMLRCFHNAFKTVPKNVKVLDYGCGPSLLPAIAAATKASEIVLAEYSDTNRRAIRQWLNGDTAASPHISFVVQELEGNGEEAVRIKNERAYQGSGNL